MQLYFRPMACSLASRIALMEAGIGVTYCVVDLAAKRVVQDDSDFLAVSAKGCVPVLVRDDGQTLTENAAVLQYIADLKPSAGLAPRPHEAERYHLQEWLSFVASEIHKAYLFPAFSPKYTDDEQERVRANASALVAPPLAIAAAHLYVRPYLLGDRFTVADAYLTWALLVVRYSGFDLVPWPSLDAYLARSQARPAVGEAITIERQMLGT